MEIEDQNKKMKILLDNISTIFAKEIEKFIQCIDDLKIEQNHLNIKLTTLIDKLENSIQQYELVNHESENCKNNLSKIIETINEKVVGDIFKIKNPNEIIYELMKMFYLILSVDQIKPNVSWSILESKLKSKNFKNELDQIINKDLNKELIDQCMPFKINYQEIKQTLLKINKNLVNILDLIQISVDFNVKRNIVKSLFQSNLNKHSKLNQIKSQIGNIDNMIRLSNEYLSVMQRELSLMLTHKNSSQIQRNIILKYDILEKYKIYINSEKIEGNFKPKLTFKLKAKYKACESFVQTILAAKDKNICLIPEKKFNIKERVKIHLNAEPNINHLNINLENKSENHHEVINNLHHENHFGHDSLAINKLNQLKNKNLNVDNSNSFRSRNINQNIYSNTNTANVIHKNQYNHDNSIYRIPNKLYYTTARTGDKTNSKTIGSTICKDVETLENIIKDDKECEVIPINFAIKPIPKRFSESTHNFIQNNKISSFSLEENRAEDQNINNSENRKITQRSLKPIEEEPNTNNKFHHHVNNYNSENNLNNISKKIQIIDNFNLGDSELFLKEEVSDIFNKIQLNSNKIFLHDKEEERNIQIPNAKNNLQRIVVDAKSVNLFTEDVIPSPGSIEADIKNIKIASREHKKMKSLMENVGSSKTNTKMPLKLDSRRCNSNYMCC